jgi:hypothetical protein
MSKARALRDCTSIGDLSLSSVADVINGTMSVFLSLDADSSPALDLDGEDDCSPGSRLAPLNERLWAAGDASPCSEYLELWLWLWLGLEGERDGDDVDSSLDMLPSEGGPPPP